MDEERILFYDPEISGHHCEFIGHLVKYLSANPDGNNYTFLLNPRFRESFPHIAAQAGGNVAIVEITPQEYTKTRRGNLMRRSFANYRLVNRYARKSGARSVVLMYFNVFQFALALRRPRYAVTGILFLQFVRQQRNSVGDKLKYMRKELLTRLYIRNKNIKTVFLLNDLKVAKTLNLRYGRQVFRMLPDPVAQLAPDPSFDVRKQYGIGKDKYVLLHIGTLDTRKGTLDILDSFGFLTPEEREGIALVLAGRASGESFCAQLQDKLGRAGIQAVWINEFVPEGVMKCLFDQSDAVLIPYKNPEASSGILGHAIAAGKPVIGPSAGLLGELIAGGFGVAMDRVDAPGITEGIRAGRHYTVDTEKAKEFVRTHSPENFAETIINSIER